MAADGVRGEAVGKGGEPLGVAGNIGHAEAGVRDAGEYGSGEGEPLFEKGIGVPRMAGELGVANGSGEAVCLVADLDVFEFGAEGPGNEGGLFSGEGGGVGPEIDAVQTGPSGGVEKAAKLPDGLWGYGVNEIGRRVS